VHYLKKSKKKRIRSGVAEDFLMILGVFSF